jgi:hypothetical protein
VDFLQIIKKRISEQTSNREALHNDLLTPEFHARRIAGSIDAIIPQIKALDLDTESLKQEFILILGQIPEVVASTWSSQIASIRAQDDSIKKYHEMQDLYNEWYEEQEATLDREAKLKKEINDGKIKEPSKVTGRKRKVGARPPITLGRYRALSNTSEGEDE